jgi:hypothetical protein
MWRTARLSAASYMRPSTPGCQLVALLLTPVLGPLLLATRMDYHDVTQERSQVGDTEAEGGKRSRYRMSC